MSSIALCCCGDPVFGGSVEPPPPMDVSMTNIGGGAEVYNNASGPNPFELRTLVGDGGAQVTQLASTIEISVTCENTYCLAPQPGVMEVYRIGTANPFEFRTIIPEGGYLTGIQYDDCITLTAPAQDTLNLGGGVGIGAGFGGGTSGFDVNLRSLVASTGINIQLTGGGPTFPTITITNTDPGSAVTLASAGGTETLVVDGTGPGMSIKGLTAGTAIALTPNATSITLTNTDPGSAVSLASVGAGASLVQDGVAPAMALRSIVQGTGITVTQNPNDVTITNASPASSVTLTSAGGTESLVNDGTGPALANKGLTAGTGTSLSSTATAVTITNADPGSAVTLSSTGAGASLVQDGLGPGLAVRSLTQGSNITIVQNANDVQISATAASSPGMEVIMNVNGSTVAVSTRRITVSGRQCFVTQARVNIAAGTQVVKLQARSVSSGTTTLHNVQMWAQSTLGTNSDVSTTAFSTSSTTFVDVTSVTFTLNAGDWVVMVSGDCTPP